MARPPRPITERIERFVRKNGPRLLRRAEDAVEITGRARDLLDVAAQGAEHLARTLTRGLNAAQGGRTGDTPSIDVRPAPRDGSRDPRNR